MAVCRMCGAKCSDHESPEFGGGCHTCKGSPECKRCGHPRAEHSGTFGSSPRKCRVEVPLDDGTLAVGRCACPGYSREADRDPVGVTDVQVLRLRPPATR